MLSIYTCRAEHQGLEDVRQGDDALDAGALVHHHQPMHLAETQKTQLRMNFISVVGLLLGNYMYVHIFVFF